MTAATLTVPLYRLAHGRSGDKGNTSNLSVIAWHGALYPTLVHHLTPQRVSDWFAARRPARVTCYALPTLGALNVVLENVLDGGVNDALNLDAHGKALSFWLLDMPIPITEDLLPYLREIDR